MTTVYEDVSERANDIHTVVRNKTLLECFTCPSLRSHRARCNTARDRTDRNNVLKRNLNTNRTSDESEERSVDSNVKHEGESLDTGRRPLDPSNGSEMEKRASPARCHRHGTMTDESVDTSGRSKSSAKIISPWTRVESKKHSDEEGAHSR